MGYKDIDFKDLNTWLNPHDITTEPKRRGPISAHDIETQQRGPIGVHDHELQSPERRGSNSHYKNSKPIVILKFAELSPEARALKINIHFNPKMKRQHIYYDSSAKITTASPTEQNTQGTGSVQIVMVDNLPYVAVFTHYFFGEKVKCKGVFGVGDLIFLESYDIRKAEYFIQDRAIVAGLKQGLHSNLLLQLMIIFDILPKHEFMISHKITEIYSGGMVSNTVLHLTPTLFVELADECHTTSLTGIMSAVTATRLSDTLKIYEEIGKIYVEITLLFLSGGTGGSVKAIAGATGKKVLKLTAEKLAHKVANKIIKQSVIYLAHAIPKAIFAALLEIVKGNILLKSEYNKRKMAQQKQLKDNQFNSIEISQAEIEALYKNIYINAVSAFFITLVTTLLGDTIEAFTLKYIHIDGVKGLGKQFHLSIRKTLAKHLMSLFSSDLFAVFTKALTSAMKEAIKEGFWNQPVFDTTLKTELEKELKLRLTAKIRSLLLSPVNSMANTNADLLMDESVNKFDYLP